MNKYHSYFSLLFFFNICIAMDKLPSIKISTKDNTRSVYIPTNQEKNYLQQRRATQNKPASFEHKPLYLQSKVQKPQLDHTKQRPEHRFIYDAYTSRRGEPKMLSIYCNECSTLLVKYQKDGPGRLLRCYLDRIHAPVKLQERQYQRFDVRTSPNLSCSHCRLIIGKPMIYKSENRPAYNLLQSTFYIKEN